jgi:hypothetical protein
MPYVTALEYYEAITVLESQELLMTMQACSYPHMKKESQNSFHRKVERMANPKELKKEISFDKFFEVMNG